MNSSNRKYLGMETPGDALVMEGAGWLAHELEPWLPKWLWTVLVCVLIVPVTMLACVEYVLRWLVTPRRYWERS
jgi:hypothetical protein